MNEFAYRLQKKWHTIFSAHIKLYLNNFFYCIYTSKIEVIKLTTPTIKVILAQC